MAMEKSLNYVPCDVSSEKCGYDIESSVPGTGKLRFIEVKGRIEGAKTVTITKNEILTALNKPDDFILALVLVPPVESSPGSDPWEVREEISDYDEQSDGCKVYYIRKPFQSEPDFGVTSVKYDLDKLIAKAESMS